MEKRVTLCARRIEDARVGERIAAHLVPDWQIGICALNGQTVDIGGVRLIIDSDTNASGIATSIKIEIPGQNPAVYTDFDNAICDPRYDGNDWDRRRNERIRRSVFKVITENLMIGGNLFWGILVGVRPSKVVHRLWDKGFRRSEIAEVLEENYLLHPDKIELLLDIVELQRSYLLSPKDAARVISIYLGVPFCPTRCHYCSFAAYPLRTHGHLVKGFIDALLVEIRELGELVQKHDLEVQSVYIGGGTPSSLGAPRVKEILECLDQAFKLRKGVEYTFEAGRPDTITQALLDTLIEAGVNRVSINPQTMKGKTLETIGRSHTPEDVYQAMELAKPMGFESINMDMILGLPGEGVADVAATLEHIDRLNPDNLTVHTLSLKHAAKWRGNMDLYHFPTDTEVIGMLELTREFSRKQGLTPYYMYRQRFIAADLENVGYARPGLASIYNIQMMEERQTVIGLGGGGVTKMVDPQSWELERHFNPKCPATFANKYDTTVRPKLEMLDRFFTTTRKLL